MLVNFIFFPHDEESSDAELSEDTAAAVLLQQQQLFHPKAPIVPVSSRVL